MGRNGAGRRGPCRAVCGGISAQCGDAAAAADQHLRGGSGQEQAAAGISRRGQRDGGILGLQRRGEAGGVGRARQWLSGRESRRQEGIADGRRYRYPADAAAGQGAGGRETYSAGIPGSGPFSAGRSGAVRAGLYRHGGRQCRRAGQCDGHNQGQCAGG